MSLAQLVLFFMGLMLIFVRIMAYVAMIPIRIARAVLKHKRASRVAPSRLGHNAPPHR
jgi:hypothetical protein